MFALLIPVIVGFVGLGVETSFWFASKRSLQSAADAAAICGAYEVQSGGSSSSSITTAATTEATRNGFNSTDGSITVSSPPNSGSYTADGSAVEVTVSEPRVHLFLGALLGAGSVTISARAVATNSGIADTCFLSLNETQEKAFHLSNNVDLPSECGVYVNSSSCTSGSTGALFLDNNSTIAGTTRVVGCTHENSPNAEVTGTLTEGVAALTDPFAAQETDIRDDISNNTSSLPTSCNFSPGNNQTETVNPGYYDDCTFGVNGTIQLNSGTFYISSSLVVEQNVTVSGTDVTIVLLENTDLDFGNNGTVSLTAPTSGTYDGIAITAHPDIDSSKQVVFHNSIELEIEGALYFPNQTVEMSNGSDVTDGCTLIVADIIFMHNNVDLSSNCTSSGDEKLSAGTKISLVE